MNKHLKDTLTYISISLLFFFLVSDWIFPIMIVVFKICFYALGVILALASLGSLSDFMQRNKNEKEPSDNIKINP